MKKSLAQIAYEASQNIFDYVDRFGDATNPDTRVDQRWESEETAIIFDDGSELIFSGSDCHVSHAN